MAMQAFYRNLRALGYEVKFGKYVAIRPQGKERFVRLKTLGEEYTVDTIAHHIMRQRYPELQRPAPRPAPKRAKAYGDFHLSRITFKGLRALYFHYLHLLRKAQNQSAHEIPFVLKEDLRKLDEFSRQTVLLMEHKIEMPEQLAAFIADRESEIERLCAERSRLNNRIRCASAEGADKLRIQRNALTTQITELRKQRKIANGAIKRAEEIHKKIDVIRGWEIKKVKVMTRAR